MTNNEYNKYVNELALMLDDVLTFKVLKDVKYCFKTADEYLSEQNDFFNNRSNQFLARMTKRCHYDREYFTTLIGDRVKVNGKLRRCIKDVLSILKQKSKYLVFVGKCDKTYKNTNKKFNHKSFVMIDGRCATRLFNDIRFEDATSDVYSDTACKIIFDKILRMKTIMTKAEKEQSKKNMMKGSIFLHWNST